VCLDIFFSLCPGGRGSPPLCAQLLSCVPLQRPFLLFESFYEGELSIQKREELIKRKSRLLEVGFFSLFCLRDRTALAKRALR